MPTSLAPYRYDRAGHAASLGSVPRRACCTRRSAGAVTFSRFSSCCSRRSVSSFSPCMVHDGESVWMDTKGAREARARVVPELIGFRGAECGSGAAEGDSLPSRGSAHKWDLDVTMCRCGVLRRAVRSDAYAKIE
eukprot:scaffold56006_cov62-Phaeocystis_antarctica.AAC.2